MRTRIRENLFDLDASANMLHPAVVEILRELRPEDYPEEILRFRDKYTFLSNDYPAETEYDGIVYPCAASAYFASLQEERSERLRIAAMNPDKAKQKYRAVPDADGLTEARIAAM